MQSGRKRDPDSITVVGAREHNLKGVDLTVPRDSLVVFTGLSGSGKSSLAFDTIFQEGQRRFLESLSSYARQFLGGLDKPQVDLVTGLSPTISIDQKTVNRNPRSTVGTVTEVMDHLRLLLARLGVPHCPKCDAAITDLSPAQIADSVLGLSPGARVLVLAPIVMDRKGEYRKELDQLRRDGWVRARIDGEVRRLEDDIKLERYEKHTIEIVLDRVKANPENRSRVVEAVERGLELAGGVVSALVDEQHHTWSSSRACTNHPEISIPELEPRLFSFNTAQGACTGCKGLGQLTRFDPSRMVDPDGKLPEALLPVRRDVGIPFASVDDEVVKHVAKAYGGDLRKRWKDQPEAVKRGLLFGEGEPVRYVVKRERGGKKSRQTRDWRGILPTIQHVLKWVPGYDGFDAFRATTTCSDCGGARLNPVARAVTFRRKGIGELSSMNVQEAETFFAGIRLRGNEARIGRELVREIRERLHFLVQVGLGYLSLDRSAATLSGGEAQRIRLAAQVGSALRGVTYVLDEPSIGLHPRDNRRLLDTLVRLRDQGNSVLVVEHDRETMEAADYLVDVGPGAGRFGGEVAAEGPPARFVKRDSLTARYLKDQERIPLPDARRAGTGEALTVVGARQHNLRDLTVRFPLGQFVVLTGVSGSGKSTLLMDVLWPALQTTLYKNAKAEPGDHDRVEGLDQLDKVVVIDQSPIGRTPRSNPATYAGAFTPIRALFAKLPEARARGYKQGRFSFNVKGGRCEACEGAGVKTVSMQFLADVEVTCEVCEGQRYNPETLEVRFRGKSITDVLEMSIEEAARFFENHRVLKRILGTLEAVGLGYVKLGQPATTLSGGEAQRVKLAKELQRPATGRTLYLLDEPTTGLHFEDVKALLAALGRLVDAGNTVVVIEHNTDVIKVADHLIELGPDGGEGGGQLVAAGTPEDVARTDSPTGVVLAELPEFGGPPTVFAPRKRRKKHRSGDLEVKGATCHNLKGVDLVVPRNSLTVLTGVSGSGKTSLAFDTVFAEGQRRYVESLSTYARRFLGRMGRAPVEGLEGLAPAIAIHQKTASHNPRSTVATVTEIYDYLRLLWARIGLPHCASCGAEVRGWSPSAGAHRLKAESDARGWLTALLPPDEHAAERRTELLRAGFLRLLDGQQEVSLETSASEALLAAGATLVVDRVRPARSEAQRLSEALQTAYGLGGGEAIWLPRGGEPVKLTELPTCPDHGKVLPEAITPRHFSFNSQLGACPGCDGLGKRLQLDPDLLFPRPDEGLYEGMDKRVSAVVTRSARLRAIFGQLVKSLGLTIDTPVRDWTSEQRRVLLEGDERTMQVRWSKKWGKTRHSVDEELTWTGLFGVIEGWTSPLTWLRRERPCTVCSGGRLRRELQAVLLGGSAIGEVCQLTVVEALGWFRALELDPVSQIIGEQALGEVEKRLAFLTEVGLGYLGLDRSAGTLSGGESQRIRLASQLGSGLTGCIYVLDEPTIGLHPRDTQRLLGTLLGLRDLGNTVLVVEHDVDTMELADHLVDLGPGAGEHGGEIVARGTLEKLRANPLSVTGAFLCGDRAIPVPEKRRRGRGKLKLTDARLHNLQDVAVDLPVGALTVVTGVSGSGKSTLVMDCLVPALQKELALKPDLVPPARVRVPGKAGLKKLVVVDQQPIGRTPRSTPATYTKAMDELRKLYARVPLAVERGYGPGRFSYNVGGGQCPHCEGRGSVLVEMHFLSDVWVECEHCHGRRYNQTTLEVRWKGHSIADVLDMRVDDALELFANHRKLKRLLTSMHQVGLGYLRLGQAATTLSGGEAQRVKLAHELAGRPEGAVFVLDEPSTGLHLADVEKLVEVLHRLVDGGATVVVVEHHPDLIKNADHVVDLGPEGGAGGGRILVTGTPEDVVEAGTDTGDALAGVLATRPTDDRESGMAAGWRMRCPKCEGKNLHTEFDRSHYAPQDSLILVCYTCGHRIYGREAIEKEYNEQYESAREERERLAAEADAARSRRQDEMRERLARAQREKAEKRARARSIKVTPAAGMLPPKAEPTPKPAPPPAPAKAEASSAPANNEPIPEDELCSWHLCDKGPDNTRNRTRPGSKYCSRDCSNKNARWRHKQRRKQEKAAKA